MASTESFDAVQLFARLRKLSDEELHSQYKNGDRIYAPQILDERYFRRITVYVAGSFRILQNDAGEISNDALLQALERTILAQEQIFKRTIFRIARHLAIDRLRYEGRRITAQNSQPVDEVVSIDSAANSDLQVAQVQIWAALLMCRDRLARVEREVVLLFHEDFSWVQMGENLGCSDANCKAAFNRAKKKMQACLAAKGHTVNLREDTL